MVADYPEITVVPTIPVLENTLLLSDSEGGNGVDELSDGITSLPDHVVVSCQECSLSLGYVEKEASSLTTHLSTEPLIESAPGDAHSNGDHIRYWNSLSDREFDIGAHEAIVSLGLPNYRSCRIPVRPNLNIEFLMNNFIDYHDYRLVDLLEFGFPIGATGPIPVNHPCKNHRGVLNFPSTIDKYIDIELRKGSIMGLFHSCPFSSKAVYSQLSTAEKKDSTDRCVVMDLSYPPRHFINDMIDPSEYLGTPSWLRYSKVDHLVDQVKKKGRGCASMKRDFSRAFRQLPVDPGDFNLLVWTWQGRKYFDKSLAMGMNISPFLCQSVTDAIRYIYQRMGFDLVNYLDDLATAEIWDKVDEADKKNGSSLR